jgi:hypothetical protein
MKKLLLAALFTFTLIHAENEALDERQPVGTRELSPKERHEIQEQRAQREEEAKEHPEEAGIEVAKGMGSSTLDYTSHMGAYHHPVLITPMGDTIELEDGSRWGVRYSDRNKNYNWLTSDTIKITPNTSWFSSYQYKLTNLNTSETLEVNLVDRPIYKGVNSHWIIYIDAIMDQVTLEDGSLWKLNSLEYFSVYSKWMVGDSIIIGHNDGFFSSSRPNILINCDTNNHVDARCKN